MEPVRDDNGRLIGTINAFHDATLDNERRFREMIDALPAAIYTTDAEGRLTDFNRAAVEFSGRTPQLGTDHWCVSWKLYYPDGTPMPHDRCPMAVVLKENRPVGGQEIIAERPDGTRVWCEPYSMPLHDAGGRLIGGINMLVDITERKRAEEASARLAAIVESSDDAIISKDLNGVITSWNAGAERLFGYTAQEAIGRPVTMLMPPDRVDEESEILKRIRCGERIDHYETVRRRKDGTLLNISLTVSPIVDPYRRIVGASKIARDITERKRAEEALKDADRRKDEFLAQLSHELRNPLAPIRNAMQLLRLKGSDEPELRWSRDVIDRQVSHLTRLIDDLLDISRITSNKLELRKQWLELAEVVQGAVETSRPAIEQCGHELTVSLPPEPVYLYGDLVRLAQVFMNLLTNAAKYTESGGRIELTAESQGGEVVVRVKDTGVGIPAENLHRVFEMFYQVEHSLGRSQGGLGIGLSLVRRLIELHGGTVEAHSDGPGKGTEFVVRLPVLFEEAKPVAPLQPSGDGAEKAAVRQRILVVDDNQDSADSLAMLLRATGHDVETAYDGLQGVQAAGRFRPNVVLLDIGMPTLDGYNVCRRIREQPWGKNISLIALTGLGQEGDRRRTEEAGFDAHIVKPVDYATLSDLLGRSGR